MLLLRLVQAGTCSVNEAGWTLHFHHPVKPTLIKLQTSLFEISSCNFLSGVSTLRKFLLLRR